MDNKFRTVGVTISYEAEAGRACVTIDLGSQHV